MMKHDNSRRKGLRQYLPFCWADLAKTVAFLLAATVLCHLLRLFDTTDVYVALIFELAVVLISRFTNGYLFGLMASVLSVIGINFIFTYPYYAFNFTIPGYPLTFLVMLAVSVSVSTLTTQIKRQEKLRAEAETEKMRGNLLRAVSHDIRTPLTSIIGAAQTLLEKGEQLPRQTSRELVTGIREESQWLVGVVENLLSVTRISGAAPVKKTLEPGEEILAAAHMKFQKRFPQTPVEIRAPEKLLMIPMDPILIQQVLINLMENAVIHGKTTTKIELSLTEEAGNAVFSVIDDGQGIAREVLPKLFQSSLYRAHGEEADGKRNMGIGLSVCRSIVQAHGGGMTGENLDTGACFRFTLPMEDLKDENQREGARR